MATYWVVETYSKTLLNKQEDASDERDQEVVGSRGASNEQCLLLVPEGVDPDWVTVDGDPGELGDPEAEGAAALSLSENTDGKEEADWAALRAERNARLAAADWTQLADSPMSGPVQEEWVTYRQALRDLPAETLDPADPEWPAQPE